MPLTEIVVGRDREDLEKYGKEGTVFLGKHIVGEGEEMHLTNPVHMDVARPHVMLICGKRGQGKSYTAAVMIEEMLQLPENIRNNLSILVIDTAGIFWSLKNQNEQQFEELNRWGLKPRGFDVSVYIPEGFRREFDRKGIPYDSVFSIKPSELTVEDWSLAFGISLLEPMGILLERVLKRLKGTDYSIHRIVREIERDQRASKQEKEALENRFISAADWGIFSDTGFEISELLKPGKVSIMDVSLFSGLSEGWSVRSLFVGLLARRIFEVRTIARRKEEISTIEGGAEREVPLTWMIIDEAHQFLPNGGTTAASDPLLTIVKQGRQPGISTVFITQRPNKLHEDAISQADIVLSHRLTAKPDLEALRNIMQTYLLYDIEKYINALPRRKGAAIILDDNSERIYEMIVRPRLSWHAGGTPSALEMRE
ncbi:MAG: ATP-binding protein [Candidatus Aenigmatarchaeota archaeon]|nr:MAG: ATP-binding protein [Candidatus Aenigmarchaeota archaeon]